MSDLPVGEVTTLSELLCANPQRVTVAGTARLQLEAARLCDELEAMTNERDSLRAAIAKREAVAEVSPEWLEIGHKIASDCADDVSFDYTGATPLWQRRSYQPRVWWSWGNFIAREVGGQWNLIERSKGGDRMVFSHEYFQEVQAHAAMLAASQQAAKGEGT